MLAECREKKDTVYGGCQRPRENYYLGLKLDSQCVKKLACRGFERRDKKTAALAVNRWTISSCEVSGIVQFDLNKRG